MKPLYLNAADSRKSKLLDRVKVSNPEKLHLDFNQQIRDLLHITQKDFLGFSQNATTSLIHALIPIFSRANFPVLLDSHEIRWYRDAFKMGKLPTGETTFPSYAGQTPVQFIKKKITIFDPVEFVHNPSKFLDPKKPSIIILSHVSRMTGELFVTSQLYKKIKKINSANILVVDGAQLVGAMKVYPKTLSDIYIGVTSKFIGAEPHIAFCWVSSVVAKIYSIKPWGIDPYKFRKEIYSASSELKKKRSYSVKGVRTYFEKKLKENGIAIEKPKNQVDHILLIPVSKSKVVGMVQKLKKRAIILSSNTGWSIHEPKVSCLRISIQESLTHKDIDYFVKVFLGM